MKLKALAKELGIQPVGLIEALEKEIAPGCNALTELSDEQIEQARALFVPAAQPAATDFAGGVYEEATKLLVQDERSAVFSQEVLRLVNLYVTENRLPVDGRLAVVIRELGDRSKKRPLQTAGAVNSLAAEVEVRDGTVFMPTIEIQPIETTLAPSLASPGESLKSAAVPVLEGSDG